MSEETAVAPPGKLSPNYRPAEEDSLLMIRFSGNTAQVADFNTKAIDAFQLFAAAGFLKMKAEQTVLMIEAQAMQQARQSTDEAAAEAERRKILVAGRVPHPSELPPEMRPPEGS